MRNGRSDRIRTCDVLLPKQVLYQAELRSEPTISLGFGCVFRSPIERLHTAIVYWWHVSCPYSCSRQADSPQPQNHPAEPCVKLDVLENDVSRNHYTPHQFRSQKFAVSFRFCSTSSPGCLVRCFPMLPEMTEADQFVALFIPQAELDGFQARKEGDRFDLLKKRIGFVAPLQIVIWNARAQMVDVMEPDIARKPLQNLRQLVKRTALECRCRKTPIVTPAPNKHLLKLMLDVERARPPRHRQPSG